MTVQLIRTDGGARWRRGGDAMNPSPAEQPDDMSIEDFEELARRAPRGVPVLPRSRGARLPAEPLTARTA